MHVSPVFKRSKTYLGGEVEAEAIGWYETTLLVSLAQEASKSEVENVGSSVIAHQTHSAYRVQPNTHLFSQREAALQSAQVKYKTALVAHSEHGQLVNLKHKGIYPWSLALRRICFLNRF